MLKINLKKLKYHNYNYIFVVLLLLFIDCSDFVEDWVHEVFPADYYFKTRKTP